MQVFDIVIASNHLRPVLQTQLRTVRQVRNFAFMTHKTYMAPFQQIRTTRHRRENDLRRGRSLQNSKKSKLANGEET